MSTDSRIPRGYDDTPTGRGIDALFSTPASWPHLLDTPTRSTQTTAAGASSAGILPVENHLGVSDMYSGLAGEGVIVSDEELLNSIDLPLADPQAPQQTKQTPPAPGQQYDYSTSQQQPIVGESGEEPPTSPFAPRPVAPVTEPQQPQRTPDQKEKMLTRIEEKRIRELHAQIDELYREIPVRINNRSDLSGDAMELLRQARTILIERPEDFVEAEYRTRQASIIFNRIETMEAWGDRYGWRVFWYELGVLTVLVASFMGLLIFSQNLILFLAQAITGVVAPSQGILTAVGFWSTFVWGGIGGAVGAMYILWTHVAQRQDFERQHVMWYIVQPIMGMVLGGVTFLVLYSGLMTLQASQPAAMALTNQVQLFPCLVAFIAGFRPQFIFGLLTKIIKVINPLEERSS